MGMLLRRRSETVYKEPKVNGKPVNRPPKSKKLNLDPVYPQSNKVNNVTTINDLEKK